MRIFDSHAHYDDNRYKEDFDSVIHKVKAAGVEKIMTAGVDPESTEKIIELCKKDPIFICSAGIHPSEVSRMEDSDIDKIAELAKAPEVHAIGEIGLDYHYGKEDAEKQKMFFKKQLEIAESLSLPVIIHSREATADTMNIIRESGYYRGVVHCFSGSTETMNELLSMGFYIGFTGVVTFKNAAKTVENVRAVPIDRLLVETDCPYMAPEPHRGERNDSSYLKEIIEKIALIKGISPETIAKISFENASKLFKI